MKKKVFLISIFTLFLLHCGCDKDKGPILGPPTYYRQDLEESFTTIVKYLKSEGKKEARCYEIENSMQDGVTHTIDLSGKIVANKVILDDDSLILDGCSILPGSDEPIPVKPIEQMIKEGVYTSAIRLNITGKFTPCSDGKNWNSLGKFEMFISYGVAIYCKSKNDCLWVPAPPEQWFMEENVTKKVFTFKCDEGNECKVSCIPNIGCEAQCSGDWNCVFGQEPLRDTLTCP